MTSPRLRGVIAATATPVDAGLRPDLERLVRHCRSLLDDGCDAINLLGTTGEATAFGVAERLAVMRAVAQSGLPLDRFMVGTGVPALDETVTLTRAACELGFAGALVLPPFYYPDVCDDGLVAYVDALVERVADPKLALYLYHIPQNTKVPWPLDVVVRLRDRHGERVVGLKDSAGDLAYARSIVAALPGFDVFPSSEATLGSPAVEKFAGCISATVNVTARESQAAWAGQGTPAGAAAAKKAAELRAIVAAHPLVAAVKSLLAARYRDEAWARMALPLVALDTERAAALRAAYERRAAAA
ncbi:MAG: dihydrodipicolinate synthase family protein [Rhizobacter sp.]|nr:dihydrodipicolinate synthase family protein [Rhizobacter sp.]